MQGIARAQRYGKRREIRMLGLAVGLPGLVEVKSGTLVFAPNLGWSDLPVRELLAAKFDFPIFVDNEAKLAALGESYFGVARGYNNVLYIYVAAGLAGGYVVDERIEAGATGFAGQFGHMTIDPDGPKCRCGNRGCWETFVSQASVCKRVVTAIESGSSSKLVEMTQGHLENLDIDIIVQAAQLGDLPACQALEKTGEFLGIGIANLVNAMEPEMVVLGGPLSRAGEFLLPAIRRVLQERALRWSSKKTQVLIGANGSEAAGIGGIAVVYQHILNAPNGHRHRRVPA
jgi:glucokinase-like ROK family protein